MNKYISRIAVSLVLIVLGVFLFIHYDLSVYLTDKDRAIALLESYGSLSVFIFILLQILQVIIAPFPGEVTGFIGGYLYGPLLGTLYSTIGLTIGSWMAFALARWLGMPLVERFVKPSTVQKYDHFMTHQGVVVIFFLFLIPGFPKDSLCYIIGLSHMKTLSFLVVSTIGRLLGTIGLSISGAIVRDPCRENIPLMVILAVGSLAFLVAYFYREKILKMVKKIREKHHKKHD